MKKNDHRNQAQLYSYELPGGLRVLAGKRDCDNDALSLKLAQPNDWWFHIKGMPGSHVILRVEKGNEPDKAVLKQAASIAAYHSKARSGGTVAVSCTRAQYVTKRRGDPPGTVRIRKDFVLKVRPGLPENTAPPDDRP